MIERVVVRLFSDLYSLFAICYFLFLVKSCVDPKDTGNGAIFSYYNKIGPKL